LYLAKGESDRAKQFYGATLSLNPVHERALNNLGVVALNEGDWPRAGRFFSLALEQSPEDAKVHYLLAQAELKQGQLRPASIEIGRALELRPGQQEFERLQEEINRLAGGVN
jgi:Flp pilus assembly protein TadD